MSLPGETRQAYDRLIGLLDQEIRKRSGSTKDLERFRAILDEAFYLLGWAQFEYLVKKQAKDIIDDKIKTKTIDRHAWRHLKVSGGIGQHLDLAFHADPAIRAKLGKDYNVRNGVAHEHKPFPPGVRDISAWLENLNDLVEKF